MPKSKSLALILGCLGFSPILIGLDSQLSPVAIAQLPIGTPILYVHPTRGNDLPRAGTEATPYRTLTFALQQAQPGSTIRLSAGSYTQQTGEQFPLVIKSGITLLGEESKKGSTVLILGGGTYTSPTFGKQNVTLRAEPESSILGITVTNPNPQGVGLWIESGNPVISNNRFASNQRDGIFVSGTASPQISGNLFTANEGNGLTIARSAQGTITRNVFDQTSFGIAVSGTAKPLIRENRITGNTDGIVVSNAARPVLRGNVIEKNQRDGVVAIAEAQPDLGTQSSPGGNSFQNNGRYDLYNSTQQQTIPAFGNTLDAQKLVGKINLEATQLEAPIAPAKTTRFRDMQQHWAQDYIEALAAKRVINGFPDGTFRPSEPVTRAQFATIIHKAFTPKVQRLPGQFIDVQPSFWGYQSVQAAYRGGFLSGYPGKVFFPERRIPRVQVLVALVNGLKLKSGDLKVLNFYRDGIEVPTYAAGLIAAATQQHLVVNYPNLKDLNPNRDATRAEVAAFVYQSLSYLKQAPELPSPYLVTGF